MPQTSRLIGLAGAAWGGVLLVWGDDLWRAVERRDPGDAERLVTRVLGVRHLVQGLAQVAAPSALRGPVVVDALHAASMLPLALVDPGYRRPALLSGGLALLSAIATASTTGAFRRRARGRHRAA
ncbi:MAG: hypothetical protein ABI336_00890 [Humibacillus sp.]